MTTIDDTMIATGRPGGTLVGAALIAPVVLTVMAAVMMVPIIPQFSAAYSDNPNAHILIPVAITIPALFLALGSPFAGWIADRFGRRPLLLLALAAYAAVGTAPTWIPSIEGIIASRALLGLCEAAIMTCSTALICDTFSGRDREKWLSLQSVTAAISAVVLIGIGGVLGEHGWRFPFYVYALALVLILPIVFLVDEPKREAKAAALPVQTIPWRVYGWICLLGLFASMVFNVVPIQIGFILEGQGVRDPQSIGLVAGGGSLAVPLGAILFNRVSRHSPSLVAAFGFAVIAAGLAVVGISDRFETTLAGSVIHGFGWGILLPTLLTWAMAMLHFDLRGRGTGAFMGTLFIGQFLSPLGFIAAAALSGSLSGGVLVFSAGGLAVAAAILLAPRAPSRPA